MRQLRRHRGGIAVHPVKQSKSEIAHKSAHIVAKGQCVAHKRPKDGNKPKAGVAIHMGGKNIAGADQATIKQGQSRNHEHDHGGADNDKGSIRGIHRASLIITHKVCVLLNLFSGPAPDPQRRYNIVACLHKSTICAKTDVAF